MGLSQINKLVLKIILLLSFLGLGFFFAQNVNAEAYDLSSVESYPGIDISSEDSVPEDIAFNTDGTKMFIIASTADEVNEYDLSTAFDVTTASYTVTIDVTSEDNSPRGIAFNNDGTKMFLTGNENDSVYEYDLSTGFDISTATHTETRSVNSEDTIPEDVAFNNDGTKMFIVGNTGQDVNEYDLSSAFDISTATHTATSSVGSQDIDPTGIEFNTDGTKMYISGTAGDDIYEYELSSAFDVTTASYTVTFSINPFDNNLRGLAFNTDGTKLFAVGSAADDVTEYTLTTGFDLSTAQSEWFDVSSQEINPQGVAFNTDGTKMFVVGNAGDDVYEYDLSTGFDVKTASFVDSLPVNSQDGTPTGLAFNTDGTKMFISGDAGNEVNEYDLSAGFDVSTASHTKTFSVTSENARPQDLTFNTDGTKMYVVGSNAREVNEYDLSSGFDISTASFTTVLSVSSENATPTSVLFNSDGTRMFILDGGGDEINEYDLSTGFDISTASYTETLAVDPPFTDPEGLAFNSDGTKLFIVGSIKDLVYQYTITASATTSSSGGPSRKNPSTLNISVLTEPAAKVTIRVDDESSSGTADVNGFFKTGFTLDLGSYTVTAIAENDSGSASTSFFFFTGWNTRTNYEPISLFIDSGETSEGAGSGDSSSTTTREDLLRQIEELVATINALRSQQGLSPISGGSITSSYPFVRDLTLGSEGDDVIALQDFLIGQSGVHAKALKDVFDSGVVKGFFYTLTQSALAEFQEVNGIDPPQGYFGPITRGFLRGE